MSCVEYTGTKLPKGYGRFRDGKRVVYAHRYAWEQEHGPIPDGMFVCHACDNPSCVNVDHLFLGTPQDNMDDKMRKGRHRYGQRLKLTDDQVREIRRRAASGESRTLLSREYGVTRTHVTYIVNNKTRVEA